MGYRVNQIPRLAANVMIFLVITAVTPPVTLAATVPHVDGFIGKIQQYKIRNNESLIEIARRFDLGYNAIVAANSGVDPFIPKPGTIITIPTAWIPPTTSVRPAIIVNIPEFRLYYFPTEVPVAVVTFPLGIGDEGRETPTGTYAVIEKIANPAWYVPRSIRENTRGFPRVVPPGPKNPMGSHALRLSRNNILIHGTNRPWGIGRRSSHGCLRLYPEDIVRLFKLVETGIQVVIVNQPLKISERGNSVFIEVHGFEDGEPSVGKAMHMLADRNLLGRTDFAKLIRAIKEKKGMPVEITVEW